MLNRVIYFTGGSERVRPRNFREFRDSERVQPLQPSATMVYCFSSMFLISTRIGGPA